MANRQSSEFGTGGGREAVKLPEALDTALETIRTDLS